MSRPYYIAIEGAIGVGKTTLARLVGARFGAEILLEVFEENPFLRSFYEDRARYAFQTQIFFLLSRYRQQHEVVSRVLESRPLVSDYSFAKDRLFAHLNLAGNELTMYEQVHAILARNIPLPDLTIFLRASTDTLMQRIASRDRPYERNMSRQYIDDLRLAYEQFFLHYTDNPVLTVDTNDLDVVANPDDLDLVLSRMRLALEQHAFQPVLPNLDIAPEAELRGHTAPGISPHATILPPSGGRPPEAPDDLCMRYLALMQGMGQISAEIAALWKRAQGAEGEGSNALAAPGPEVVDTHRARLRDHLTATLRRLLALARDANVDVASIYPDPGHTRAGQTQVEGEDQVC